LTNKLAFILNKKRIVLKDRPPAQSHDGRGSDVRKECIVQGHRWIDIKDDLPRALVMKADDI